MADKSARCTWVSNRRISIKYFYLSDPRCITNRDDLISEKKQNSNLSNCTLVKHVVCRMPVVYFDELYIAHILWSAFDKPRHSIKPSHNDGREPMYRKHLKKTRFLGVYGLPKRNCKDGQDCTGVDLLRNREFSHSVSRVHRQYKDPHHDTSLVTDSAHSAMKGVYFFLKELKPYVCVVASDTWTQTQHIIRLTWRLI